MAARRSSSRVAFCNLLLSTSIVSVAVCLAGACDSRIRNISARSQSHGHRPRAQELAGIEGRNKRAESCWVAQSKAGLRKCPKGLRPMARLQNADRPEIRVLSRRDFRFLSTSTCAARFPAVALVFLSVSVFFPNARLHGYTILGLRRERLRQTPSRSVDDAFERRAEPTRAEAQPAVATPRWVSLLFSDGFPTSIPRSSLR